MKPYVNLLSIRNEIKGIPYYGDGTKREDGGANYGFKDVKGNPELIESIPELATDISLKLIVKTVSAPETGLFSIGCLSGEANDELGHRYTGYIEFALNSRTGVQDACNYFPAFFHFEALLHKQHFQRNVQFYWELQPGHFIDAKIDGYTCAITVNTTYFPSPREAYECWQEALGMIEMLLGSIPPQPGEVIYSTPVQQ